MRWELTAVIMDAARLSPLKGRYIEIVVGVAVVLLCASAWLAMVAVATTASTDERIALGEGGGCSDSTIMT